MSDTLGVSEIFGPTIQGEGPHAGREAVFLRLAGCNLKCSWCDSMFTWNWSQPAVQYDSDVADRRGHNEHGQSYDPAREIHPMPTSALVRALWDRGVERKLLVVTGGEPLLQQRNFGRLFGAMFEVGPWAIEIETNGTIVPEVPFAGVRLEGMPLNFVYFNVSPKLGNSGAWNADHNPIRKDAMQWHVRNSSSSFKFVCGKSSDLDEVATIVQTYRIPSERVWIMPEGVTRARHLRSLQSLAEGVIKRGWNLTTRTHLLVWDQKRAV